MLTPEQRRAVETNAKDVVVLANPGGGKTALIVERIARLVLEDKVPPESIMALTFTSRSAIELRQRVQGKIGKVATSMWIRTFHSAGLQLIKTFPYAAGLKDDFTILGPAERRQLLRRSVVTRQKYQYLSEDELLEHITKVKNGMVLVAELPQDIQMALCLYESILQEQNAIDLDDMIVKALDLLDNPAICSQVHQRFRHILIDEYQDINVMQEKFVEKIRGTASRFLVGDPDQTIYEWRGAKPEYISTHGKHAEVIQLTKNFRSSTPIVMLANHVIEQNSRRNRRAMEGVGSDIYVPIMGAYEDEEAQATFIAKQIRQLVDDKRFRFNDIAILVRNHSQTPALEGALSEANIPYGGELFWSQPAVTDALNLLYAILQPYRNGNLAKAVNIPTRVMDNLQIQDLAKEYEIQHLSTADQLLVLSHLPGEWPHHTIFRKRLNSLLHLHQRSQTHASAPIISQLMTYFEISVEPKTDSDSGKLSLFPTLKKLLDLALAFDATSQVSSLGLFLQHINQLRMASQTANQHKGNVHILTCHHSKGLEFPVVFVIGVQLGIFPNDFFIQSQDDLEAERRLFYVAITRAKEVLYLTSYDDPEWQPKNTDLVIHSFLHNIPRPLVQELY